MRSLAVFGSLMLTNPKQGKMTEPEWNEYGIDGVQCNEGGTEYFTSPFRKDGRRKIEGSTMKLYMLLAILSGIILVEAVVVELLEVLEKRGPYHFLSQVTDLGRYLNQWVLPMVGLAAAGAVMLKMGESYPLGGLLKVSGSAVFSMFLVVFLIYMTSDPAREEIASR